MDLSASYLGLRLCSPLVASASPLSHTVDGVRRLADAGVGAVVLPSLFEEELDREAARHGALAEAGTESFAEALSYFPEPPEPTGGARWHLDLLERASAAVGIPVIASLNGATVGGWTRYARQLQDAGAAAIELNLSSPLADPDAPGRDVEQRHLEIAVLVKQAVRVPVAVKLSSFYSSIGDMARQFAGPDVGIDGLVLFNRFLHPDVDPESLQVVPGFGLSHPTEARLPRAWIALLRRHVQVSLAASTGVHDADDVARYLLVGADVVMATSALLRHGPEHATVLLEGLAAWMVRKGFATVDAARGLLAAPPETDDGHRERAVYVSALRAANTDLHGPW
jgi:dihydroorotate dehydrogenase (fumarate)